MLDVPSTEGLGLACESTDLALILIRCAASATSGPAPQRCEARLVFVFMLALYVAAQLSELKDSECFTLRPDEDTAAEHTLVWPVRSSEPNRWCAGRCRTDSPSRCCKKPWHDKTVRRPPTDGRPAPMQRMFRLTSRCNELPTDCSASTNLDCVDKHAWHLTRARPNV